MFMPTDNISSQPQSWDINLLYVLVLLDAVILQNS